MTSDNTGPAHAAHPWAVVLRARREDTARAMGALSKLCQAYSYPLYAYVRRLGHSPEESRELTHEFFTRLQQNRTLAYMKKDCGKFRSFLLTAMNHFLVDESRKGRLTRPEAPAGAPVSEKAEEVFQENWALAVAGVVYDRLKREYEELGRGDLFVSLKFCLTSTCAAIPYAELASRLSLAESSVRTLVQGLRARYGEVLREEIAGIVATPAELEEELRCLFKVATA